LKSSSLSKTDLPFKSELHSAQPLLYHSESSERKISIKISPAEYCMKCYLKDKPGHCNSEQQLKPERSLAGPCTSRARPGEKKKKEKKKERKHQMIAVAGMTISCSQ